MNVCLISSDADLKAQFENLDFVKSVVVQKEMRDLKNCDVVIISEDLISYNDFLIALNDIAFPDNSFYLMKKHDDKIRDHIQTLCQSNGIHTVSLQMTVSQIVNEVVATLFPDTKDHHRHIGTFFGADSKVGTTMVVQCCAEMLSRMSEAKVAIFHLNERPGLDYMKASGNGLDEIKVKLANDILQPEELQAACVKSDQFYVLPGPEHIMDVRHYHPQHIDRLISIAQKVFDAILIDAGCNIDNGMAVSALQATNNRFLVTTQQETAKTHFERVESQVFKHLHLKSEDFFLILNKYIKSSGLYDANTVAEMYRMPLAGYIPHLEMLGWQAEFDRKTLLHYDDEGFELQINNLVRYLAAKLGVNIQEMSQKKSLFSRIKIGGLFS